MNNGLIKILILVIFLTSVITIIYKLLPFRNLGSKKPIISIFPKYKNTIKTKLNINQLEKELASFGFKKKNESDMKLKFSRGHALGDLSIKLIKVNLNATQIEDGIFEIKNTSWLVGSL